MHVATPICSRFSLDVRVVDTDSVVQQDYGQRRYSQTLQGVVGKSGGKENLMVKVVPDGRGCGEKRYANFRKKKTFLASCLVVCVYQLTWLWVLTLETERQELSPEIITLPNESADKIM